MTLHDRIMEMDVDTLMGDNSFHEGVTVAKFKAAQLAAEADELMAEMAEALEHIWHEGDSPYSEIAAAALFKFDDWKEWNNEQ